MPGAFFDNPDLYRSVLEDLPVGVCILDRHHRVRLWNSGAEHLTGHLAHEAMGQDGTAHWLEPCDGNGQALTGEHDPMEMTLTHGHPQQFSAYFRHKEGYRIAVRVQTKPLVERSGAIAGTMFVFEQNFGSREESPGAPMYGCLDSVTGIPSHRLTRAVLHECMAGMERLHKGFGLVRVRVLGLDEFRTRHGILSTLPFLRATAHTLQHSLDPEIFLGRWGEDEFIAVLPSANPVATKVAAETVWSLVTHSDVSWWGDHFQVQAVAMYTVAQPGDNLDQLLNGLEPEHAAAAGRTVAAAAGA